MRTLISALLAVALTGCAALKPGTPPRETFDKSEWTHAPAWAAGTLTLDWWRGYRSPALNKDIEVALAHNPDLAVLAARLEQASAVEETARAASYPRINLGLGAREGRTREVDFGPYDLQPFTASSNLSWELDLTGKLRAATRSAGEAANAAFWDLRAGKLKLATQVAEAHFRTARLGQEYGHLEAIAASQRKTLAVLRSRESAGLLTSGEIQQALARQGTVDRALLDLQRLHGLAALQLATLKGQASPSGTPPLQLPSISTALPATSTSALLRQRPDLLAAEARVRSAFQVEEATRLDLLPSFGIQATAMGATNALTNRFRVWSASVGPSLDLPVYDPVRLAALKSRRAQTKTAAAEYRSTVLKAFEETEGAYLNFQNRQQQLTSARTELGAVASAHQDMIDSHRAGIISDLELFESERQLLGARRTEVALQETLLGDHLALIRALGGGGEGK